MTDHNPNHQPAPGKLGPAAARWRQLDGLRQSSVHRWEEYARWTLPHIFPRNNEDPGLELTQSAAGLGAQLVNHFANRLVMSLFPPHRSFFRLDIEDNVKLELLETLEQQAGVDGEQALQAATTAVEMRAMRRVGRAGFRTEVTDCAKYLTVTGNGLLYMPPNDERPAQAISPRDYVVVRATDKTVLELLVRTARAFRDLSPEMQALLQASNEGGKEYSDTSEVYIYTWATLEQGKYRVIEYIEHVKTDYSAIFPKDRMPMIVLATNLHRGDNYGRGLVEDHAGDFRALDILSVALLEAGVAMADIKHLVRPGAPTNIKDFNESPSGTYHVGQEGDIFTHSMQGKLADLQMVAQLAQQYEARLSKVFMLMAGQVRDAERVTAEEIRLLAMELDTAHGGLYTSLAETLQRPLATMLLERIDFKIEGQVIEPQILTGVESLSRMGDMQNLRSAIADLAAMQNIPEPMLAELDPAKALRFILTSNQLPPEKILMSETAKAERQAQMDEMNRQAINAEITTKATPAMASSLME